MCGINEGATADKPVICPGLRRKSIYDSSFQNSSRLRWPTLTIQTNSPEWWRQGMIELQVGNVSSYATNGLPHVRSCRLIEDKVVLLFAELSALRHLRSGGSDHTRTHDVPPTPSAQLRLVSRLKDIGSGSFVTSKWVRLVHIYFFLQTVAVLATSYQAKWSFEITIAVSRRPAFTMQAW